MPDAPNVLIVCCNHERERPEFRNLGRNRYIRLEYDNQPDGFQPNVRLSLQSFVRDVYHLSERERDLLEIAGFVFSADRCFLRGSPDAVEHHAWSRKFQFHITVRDYVFWVRQEVKQALESLLTFLSGDRGYEFNFYPGRPTEVTSLFDSEDFRPEPNRPGRITLFSGGLDSLTGAIHCLEDFGDDLYLVSHRSLQPSTARTQDALFQALSTSYPGRVFHYKFYCSLKGIRARDENQRTRSFLYSSIAFTLAQALSLRAFSVFENGVTAMNIPKREDMGNARASRTTHPKTISLLESLFTLVSGHHFEIPSPFLWSTKADVMGLLEEYGMDQLIPSTVSCSHTFRNTEPHTHCGECSQCIDRRISAHAAGLQDRDHSGLYTFDLLAEGLSGEAKTIALDYVRQATHFATSSIDMFHDEMINDLVDICDHLDMSDEDAINMVYRLHHTHGLQTIEAIHRMIRLNYDLSIPLPADAFLRLILDYEHLKDPVSRFVDHVSAILLSSVPIAFQRNQPNNEDDLNDKIEGILRGFDDRMRREHPTVEFALSKAVPDHSALNDEVLIESKYLREGTPPSKVSEGMAADLIKYPESCFILFVVYDPARSIKDDVKFRQDFEEKRQGLCRVVIIR